jgi:hypothetical protein
MSEKQKCKQSGYISLLLLVCLVVLLSSACDLKIQFPTLFTPTKKQLKRLIEADLPRTEALIVAFVGDDLTISFSHAVDADVITSAFKKIFSALGNHADTGSISINKEFFTLKSSSESSRASTYVLETINTTFTDSSKEEIPYTASILYKGERFSFTGELVFHDIYRKMLAPIDIAAAFLEAHDTALTLHADNLTLDDSLLILEALQDFRTLTVEAKLLLNAEKSTLDATEEAFVIRLTPDEMAAYQVIKMIVDIPSIDDLHITNRHLVDSAMVAYGTLTTVQKSLVMNSAKLTKAHEALAGYAYTIDMIGDEKHNGLFIVNRSVSSNDLGIVPIGTVRLRLGDTDVTNNYTFKFFDPDNKDEEILEFDLSGGASTFIAYMKATPNTRGYDSIEATVVFKYGSVSIRGDTHQYTIEDAISMADDNEIIVKYNTSFATPQVAQTVYQAFDYRIGSQTTLLLPSDTEYSGKTNDSASHNGSSTGPFVQLRIPEGITLSVKGRMIVHAKRQSKDQYQGFVAHPYYSILQIDEGATVQIEHRGRLDVLGYATGEGSIAADSGSTVHESLFISSYRGGSITFEIRNSVFPFDQFTANQIECDLMISSGASYIANAFLLADGSYLRSEVKLIGPDAIIDLLNGTIRKSYEASTGNVSITIKGDTHINNGSLTILIVPFTTKNKAIPFDGRWHFVVDSGNLQINSIVALLPGSSFEIQPTASVTVAKNGGLIIFDEDFYRDYIAYPNTGGKAYYRNAPTFGYEKTDEAVFINDGTLTVNGNIGGTVQGTGSTTFGSDGVKEIECRFVTKDNQGNVVTDNTKVLTYHEQ